MPWEQLHKRKKAGKIPTYQLLIVAYLCKVSKKEPSLWVNADTLLMKWIRSDRIAILCHFSDKMMLADLLTYWNAWIILTASDPDCKPMMNQVKNGHFVV